MSAKGADFSEIQPRDSIGKVNLTFQNLPSTAEGLDSGQIAQITPNNVFRLGQQIVFWLGISNPVFGAPADPNWLTRVRLKLWWARPAMEYRQPFGGGGQPGADGVFPIDRQVYGVGPVGGNPLLDNRYVWVPSPKRLDVTEFQTPPPPASPPRQSDSLMLDDLWTMDLQDPNVASYADKFTAPQEVSRWVSILYPAYGYALGFTYEATVENDQSATVVPVRLNLTWSIGTFGGSGRIQESIG